MILTAVCFGPSTVSSAARPMQEKPHRADIQVRHPVAETLGLDAFVAVGVDLLSSCQPKTLRQADTGHQWS
jgi:hypothetical protein